jgi:hypothetical protein
MEMSIAKQFTILSLHPGKGRILVPNTIFRYTLAGACLMDFYINGEITIEDKRLLPSAGRSRDQLHDSLFEKIQTSSRPRRISYWIRRLSGRGRQLFRDSISLLLSEGIVRHEKLYFLGFIPYNRYYFNDPAIRSSLINRLREVVISGKVPDNEQMMILGLMKVSRSLRYLATEFSERSVIRARCREIFRRDETKPETEKFIRMIMASVQNAIAASEAAQGA